ncbi:hypothetical protein GCM10009780_73180 [Actinomadura alba]
MISTPSYPSSAAISNALGAFSGYTDAVESVIGASGTLTPAGIVPLRSGAKTPSLVFARRSVVVLRSGLAPLRIATQPKAYALSSGI